MANLKSFMMDLKLFFLGVFINIYINSTEGRIEIQINFTFFMDIICNFNNKDDNEHVLL